MRLEKTFVVVWFAFALDLVVFIVHMSSCVPPTRAPFLCYGQNFEGINYGDRKLRDQMRAGFIDIGRRERKPAAVKAYAPPPPRVGETSCMFGTTTFYHDLDGVVDWMTTYIAAPAYIAAPFTRVFLFSQLSRIKLRPGVE